MKAPTVDLVEINQRLQREIAQLERTVQKLRGSEERLQTIINCEPECVKILGPDGSLLEMNPAGLRMLEADSFQQVENHGVYPLIVDEDRLKFQALTEKVFAGESGTLEFQLVGLKGGRRWLETHACPLRDTSGKVTALLGITRDITGRQQAEAALRASEERYRRFFEEALTGNFVSTPDGQILACNLAFARMLGFGSVAEVLEVNAATLYPPGQGREAFLELLRRDRQLLNWEMDLFRRDGQHIWIIENAFGTFDAAENLVAIHGNVFDITERQRAEEAARRSQEHLTALVQSVDGIVWEADVETFQFTFVSLRAERLLGYPLSRWTEETTFWVDHLHPEDRGEAVRYCVECTQDKRDHEFEYRMLAADGRTVWLRDIVTVGVENGRAVQLRGIMMDITEKKTAEKALKEAEEKYRSIFNNAVDGIFQTSPKGKFLAANPAAARIFGFASPEELMKERWDIAQQGYVDPRRRDEFKRLIQEQGVVKNFEYEAYRKDGSRVWISENTHAVHSPSGEILYFEGIFEDITSRKQAEEAMKQSREQLRALAANLQSAREAEDRRIARELHDELGATLTGLKIDITWLKAQLGRLRATKTLKPLRERAKRAVEMVNSTMRSVRKICLELRPDVLDQLGLAPAIEWQAKEFQTRYGIKCKVARPEAVPLPAEAATAMFRIFQEILTNVARHAQATEVRVNLSEHNGEIILEAADNGAGISKAKLAGTKHLGIVGMRERALSAGGSFKIDSQPGKGTTVTVKVPREG